MKIKTTCVGCINSKENTSDKLHSCSFQDRWDEQEVEVTEYLLSSCCLSPAEKERVEKLLEKGGVR